MTDKNNEIVEKLKTAHETREPIDFIRDDYNLDERTAYKIQDQFVTEKCEEMSEKIAGYKISMTSPDTQAYANTDEPAYGTFTESNLIHSSASVSLNLLFDPLIEPELLFILTDDLTAGASESEVIAKSKLAAGLEIPDSRYKDWFPNFSLEDLLCDNGAAGLAVVSEPVETPSFEQLGSIHMELFHDGEKMAEGRSSNVLENPASAVAWLSKKMAGHGKTLKKGLVIASGTFIPPVRARAGTYKAVYNGIGDVRVTFTN